LSDLSESEPCGQGTPANAPGGPGRLQLPPRRAAQPPGGDPAWLRRTSSRRTSPGRRCLTSSPRAGAGSRRRSRALRAGVPARGGSERLDPAAAPPTWSGRLRDPL